MQFPPRKLTIGLATFMLVVAAPFSFAQTYVGKAYEPFDYPVSGTLTTAQAGGYGFNATGDFNLANTTTWATGPAASGTRSISSESLDFIDALYAMELGNAATVTGAGAIGRRLGQTVDSGTFYFSYLTSKTVDTARSLHLAFFNNTNERLAIGQVADNSNLVGPIAGTENSGAFVALISNSQNPSPSTGLNGVYSAETPIPYTVGSTFLVVGKIEFNFSGTADRFTLYINPSSLSNEGSLSPYLVVDNNDFGALNGFRLTASNTANGFNASTGVFDEIRFGTTYADVLTSTATAIPEPSTWAALVGSLALVFAFGRKRRTA